MVIVRFAEHVPAPESRMAENAIDTKEITLWSKYEILFAKDSYAESRNFKCRTLSFSTFGIINSDPKIQDDMHDHDNDGHIFMALEGA